MKKVIVLGLVLVLTTGAMAREVALNPVQDVGFYPGVSNGMTNRGLGGRYDVGGGDGALLEFDLSGVLGAGESIQSATLELSSARNGSAFSFVPLVYPMLKDWVQGLGTSSGNVGSTGYGWGYMLADTTDVGGGDLVWNDLGVCMAYQQTTDCADTGTVIGSSDPGPYYLATAGVAWNTAAARGIGTDVANLLMTTDTFDHGAFASGGILLDSLVLNAVGVQVLNDWATGAMDNEGLNIWSDDGGAVPLASLEYGSPGAPVLRMQIVPEPMTLTLLAIGGLALVRRRRS